MKASNILKIFKKETTKLVDLSAEDLIDFAEQSVDEAMHMFVNADDQITAANAEILHAIEVAQATVDKAQAVLDKADLALEKAHNVLKANNALKVRLSEFITK